jgi:hypothetical protein
MTRSTLPCTVGIGPFRLAPSGAAGRVRARALGLPLGLPLALLLLGPGSCATGSGSSPVPDLAVSPPDDLSLPPAPADLGAPPRPAGCLTPKALPSGALYTDITEEAGLRGITGVRVIAADLNGDGWTDLVVHGGGAKARDSAAAPIKRLLLNQGGRFVDVTGKSGLLDSRDGSGTGRLSHLAVAADLDNDGDLDLFSGVYHDGTVTGPAASDKNDVYWNDGRGHFTLGPATVIGDQGLPTAGASFLDFDRDGRVDLFVTTWYDPDENSIEGSGNYLYRNTGGQQFDDVSVASRVLRPAIGDSVPRYLAGDNRRPAYGATACDVDGDGWTDLLVSAYGRSWNELWKNQGDGTFREVGFRTPVASDDNVSYSDNQFYHCYCKTYPGRCPPDVPAPKIMCATWAWTPGFDDQPARNGGNTFTTACGDIDNDGDLDLMHAEIRHWHIGQSSDPSQIIRNDSTPGALKFTRIANETSGLVRTPTITSWNEGDMEVGFFDFDNDGKKDIYLASSDYPETRGTLFRQVDRDGGGLRFTPLVDAGVGHYHAHGFAPVDIDRDGDLDLVVTTSTARCGGDPKCPATQEVRVYRNDVGHKSNFVQLVLRGGGDGKANAAAIGARVTVRSGATRQVQEVSGGYGHFGMQHDTVLTFGLGAACSADEIEVRWPDRPGSVERIANVGANQRYEIRQGSGRATPLLIAPPRAL